ncbi:hypothetical protein [Halobaculum litoreum]|uniref:hypothetical protein n=1 Tax=Halobaculum litoreum TaxID=3031998 RepID=UPI0024C3BAC9|nr:hypothetical protein [Halobaculum sp. DT92]
MIGDLLGGLTVTKQTVLVAIVGGVVVGGAGLGVLGPELGLTQGGDGGPATEATPTATPTPTPTPPPVSVTPPATGTADGDGGEDGTPPSTPSTTATASTTTTGTATTDDGGGDGDPDDSEADDDRNDAPAERPFADPALSLSVSAPADVSNDAGAVGAVGGDVDARASWTGDADAVVFVVRAGQPDGTWRELAREAVSVGDADAVDLADAVGNTSFTYVDAANASALDNPTNATAVTRSGAVAVTAVFFDDGERVGQAQRVRTYAFDVTNTGAVDLAVDERDARGLSVDDVAPGTTAERRIRVRNAGAADGTLRLAFANRTAAENGLAEPEAPVDDPGRVELLDALELRVSVADGDGGRTYLVGDADRFVRYGAVADGLGSVPLGSDRTRTVVVEWRVPLDAGNGVMTDSVGFDLRLTLTSDGLG